MNEFLDRLSFRERRTLGVLALALGAVLILFLFVHLGKGGRVRRAEKEALRIQTQCDKARGGWEKARDEESRWAEARRDLEEFKTKYFYGTAVEGRDFRLDLEALFREAGFRVTDIHFNFSDVAKARLRKITASFAFHGTYTTLRRFLVLLERSTKFLTVERIDFINTGRETGSLELKIEVAGYNEI